MAVITKETIRQVVDTIASKFRPRKIIVFGSCAKGAQGPDSDLDILVVADSEQPHYRRATPIRLALCPSPCPMDILVYTPEEIERYNGVTNHIVTEALRHGVVMYEEDDGH